MEPCFSSTSRFLQSPAEPLAGCGKKTFRGPMQMLVFRTLLGSDVIQPGRVAS